MSGFGLGFGGGRDVSFDPVDAFVPEHLPSPGPFLAEQDVLSGRDHVAFHAVSADCFETRGVYDATFGYNLARLNRDPRHPDAGLRYAVETDDRSVCRASFTPTTPFCPQSRSLTVGAFRAWNGLSDRHEFDLVRVRVVPTHNEAPKINAELQRLEDEFVGDEAKQSGRDEAQPLGRGDDEPSCRDEGPAADDAPPHGVENDTPSPGAEGDVRGVDSEPWL